jgi:hypothetical protein
LINLSIEEKERLLSIKLKHISKMEEPTYTSFYQLINEESKNKDLILQQQQK